MRYLLRPLVFINLSFFAFGIIQANSDVPAYAEIFDQIIAHDKAGRSIQALRLFPKLYDTEIPVDAFYLTLEEKRRDIIGRLLSRPSIEMDGQKISANDIFWFFHHVLTRQPRTYRHKVDVTHSLSAERCVYFYLIHRETMDDLLAKSISKRQAGHIRQLLSSSDPWIVSSVLHFFGHAEQGVLSPEDIAQRWRHRPDLWDEVCTDQALLALASHSSHRISSVRDLFAAFTQSLDRLQAIDSDASFLSVVIFGERDLAPISWNPKVSLISMKEKSSDSGTMKRWSGDVNHAIRHEDSQTRDIEAESPETIQPGTYRVSVRAQMCWGNSAVFHVPAGSMVRVFVSFQCGV